MDISKEAGRDFGLPPTLEEQYEKEQARIRAEFEAKLQEQKLLELQKQQLIQQRAAQ